MRPNRVREMFAAGELVVNGWLAMPGTYSAEGAGHCGYDCVTVDLQHGMIGFDAARDMLIALSSTPAIPFARVSRNDPALVMQLLDAGAYGVICPMISSVAEATALAAAVRYPPEGARSFGPTRGLTYGGPDYVAQANATVLALPMIETREGLEAVGDILRVPGLDGVFVGPNDLALALGERPGEAGPGSATEAAIARILAAARQAGRPAGIFCPNGAAARDRAEQGFAMVTPGNDFGLMTRAMTQAAAASRGQAGA